MTKLTFKRLALVVVTALGLGVIASGPSSAVITASSDTLTVSATASTIAAGETASVTVTQSFIANLAGDSLTVVVENQSAPASGNGTVGIYITDSSNATIRSNAQATGSGGAQLQQDFYGVAGKALTETANITAAGTTALSATYRVSFMAPTVAGTYVFRIYHRNVIGATQAIAAAVATWTVTVTANASDIGTTASKFWLNALDEYNATSRGATVSSNTYKGLEVDSALVISAGLPRAASAYTAVGVISPVVMNSSDTKISTRTGGRVLESVTVLLAGAGQLAVNSRYAGLGTTYSKQVTIAYDETAVVFSDGTVGTGTLTAYIGTSSASANAFTQGTKTVTFTGRATTFTVTGYSSAIRAGSTVKYAGAADSATAAAQAFRFLATDAAGNAVTSAALNTDKGEAAFYAISSDTSVLAAGEAGATYSASSARRSPALACTYDSTSSVKGYWYCTGRVFDSGTVTVTIVDSRDVTASGSNYLTTTTGAVAKSAAFSITYAGAAHTGTIKLDKTAYNTAEKATLTLTCKDSAGRNVADGVSACWTNLNWVGTAPTFSNDNSVNAAGGTFTSLTDYLTTGNSYVLGTDTAMVYMPSNAYGITYKLMGRTAGATVDSEILSFTVSDPGSVATLAAAEAATDAAAEAIDAANAATDAANLAAEAADAATVAAEEARDAADAATAAVEELATQVATLMAALKAQITTLANTVAKIAKKVKA
jgi:hypothetical protein